jgi:thiamine pyrophosphate-dependent acetolactate synthase large subunit-like protein
MTPPCAPTLVVVDSLLQKSDAGTLVIPQYQPPPPLTISRDEAARIAQRLLSAGNPRMEVGRLRTPQGVTAAITLAELTGVSVDTRANQGPMSFPQGHPQCGPGADTTYDFVLGLELPSPHIAILSPDIGTIAGRDANGVGLAVVEARGVPSPAAGGAERFTADSDSSLPLIIEAVLGAVGNAQRVAIADRIARHAVANRTARIERLRQQLERRRRGWDASPVSTARLYGDLWPHIANEDWCIGSQTNFSGGHHADLWQHDKPYSCLGGSGAAGIGYSLGASTGAALAARDRGRIVIDFQNDGDFNFMPGALWTAAHHRLPLLILMHNNRAWHQEFMFVQYLSGVRGRATDRSSIGTTLRDPFVDYKSIAHGYGVEAEGPISDPTQLADAYARGVAVAKQGRPYLIDVLTQPR